MNSEITTNSKPRTERGKRVAMSYLLATNPETFEIIIKNNINLFHGTNANALPNILKYGLNSVDEISERGLTVSTGEESSRIGGKRKFISFTDDIDTALCYSSLSPVKDEQENLSFGAVIGISSNDLEQMQTCVVQSDIPEIGIMNNVPLEYIKVIAVPKNKVKFVRKLIDDDKIIITPIDTDEKFYYINCLGEIVFDDEEAKKIVERQKQNEKVFNCEEVHKMAKGRKKSGIQGLYEKFFKKLIVKERNYEQDSREK